jgi:hypothetical protein
VSDRRRAGEFTVPGLSRRFARQLATISQGDGQIVFASHPAATPRLTVLNLTDNVSGHVPPIDRLAVATADRGTLSVVDASAGKVEALDTSGWPAGAVFVGEPKDNRNPPGWNPRSRHRPHHATGQQLPEPQGPALRSGRRVAAVGD